jgi:Na+:H+ antiporter, NhaA family
MKKLIRKAINPLKFFIADSRSVGILLLVCTVISLFLSNSGIGGSYRALWNQDLGLSGIIRLPHSGLKWINDFLMAFFFLLAGMEIKRELLNGELSTFKKAVLPFGAALGGMIFPALIFLLFNSHSGFAHGWGIPTATDIAFSLGIASLFGKRVPTSLKIFLMALAIIDDLGAILVIALFYGGQIQWFYLLLAALLYGSLWFCNYKKLTPGWIQFGLSAALWYMILNSGIEASISGVLIAFVMPVNSLPKIEKSIHKVVNFIILPLFALANTAILIPADVLESLGNSISMGVFAGLVIGKPVGIYLFSRMLVALKIASLPSHAEWKHLIGIGTLAGIGFTMSIFTTTLAFQGEAYRDIAKISILLSLVVSTVISGLYFTFINRKVIVKQGMASEPIMTTTPDIALG